MNDSAKHLFRSLVSEHGFAFAIVASQQGEMLFKTGTRPELAEGHLFRELFGGPEEIARLAESLEGKLLPRIWGQGKVSCFIFVPAPGLVLGFLNDVGTDAVSEYRLGQTMKAQIDKEWPRESSG